MSTPSESANTFDRTVSEKAPLDPHTQCFLVGGVIYFQGRLDGSFVGYQGPSMTPVDVPIRMHPEKFLSMDMPARKSWGGCVSEAWTQTDRIVGLMPYVIKRQEYARGHCVIERHPVALHHRLVRDFLANQTENAPAVWLGNVLVGCYLTYLEQNSMGLMGKMLAIANEEKNPYSMFSEVIASKPENFFSVTAQEAVETLLDELGHDHGSAENIARIREFMREGISTQDLLDAKRELLTEDPYFTTRHGKVIALERATLDKALAKVCNRLELRLLKEALRDGIQDREGIVDHVLATLTGPKFLQSVPADIVLASVID